METSIFRKQEEIKAIERRLLIMAVFRDRMNAYVFNGTRDVRGAVETWRSRGMDIRLVELYSGISYVEICEATGLGRRLDYEQLWRDEPTQVILGMEGFILDNFKNFDPFNDLDKLFQPFFLAQKYSKNTIVADEGGGMGPRHLSRLRERTHYVADFFADFAPITIIH